MTARRTIAALVAVTTATALAAVAGTASAASTDPQDTAAPAAVFADTVSVSFAVNKFVRKGKRLVATGAAIATFTPADGSRPTVVRQPYTARVVVPPRLLRGLSASSRICPVLFLELDKLHLELLGLIVDLDKVTLTLSANSNGGPLGALFCDLVTSRVDVRTLSKTARELTQAFRDTGLSASTVSFAVPLAPAASTQTEPCKVLDLILGPLDLRLLGLRAHLNQVHLTITANREGGALGSLFCSLADAQLGLPVVGG